MVYLLFIYLDFSLRSRLYLGVISRPRKMQNKNKIKLALADDPVLYFHYGNKT